MEGKKLNHGPAGLYIHIPFCEAKCRYCGFYSEPIKDHDAGRLVSAIITELGRYSSLGAVQTAYIGGGSPSCLPQDQLLRLIGEIASRWPKIDEFTVEINPGQADTAILSQLRAAGVNRLSIGAQSFNAAELAFLGRRHSVADIGRAVQSAKQAGFQNIGLDLIFAIPGSTLKSWKYSLRSAIELDVQHIAAYALTYEKGTPLQEAVAAGKVEIIDEDTDRAMYEMAIDELERAGFKQYEISNSARPRVSRRESGRRAKPGFECRHNLSYWANKPYIGVGPAAGSYWKGRRWLNVADINKYVEAIESSKDAAGESETPDKIQTACETAVLNLRRRCGIDLKEFKEQTGFDIMKLFAEPIGKYEKLGLIEATDGRLFLARKALPIADSILCDFSDV